MFFEKVIDIIPVLVLDFRFFLKKNIEPIFNFSFHYVKTRHRIHPPKIFFNV